MMVRLFAKAGIIDKSDSYVNGCTSPGVYRGLRPPALSELRQNPFLEQTFEKFRAIRSREKRLFSGKRAAAQPSQKAYNSLYFLVLSLKNIFGCLKVWYLLCYLLCSIPVIPCRKG